ncbi:FHA domain-containing protein [Isosphaeraceae bacterium EP7]
MPTSTYLHIRSRDSAPTHVVELVGASVRIGVGPECEVRLPDEPGLADVEVLLRRRGETWHAQPMASAGGLLVDGRAVDRPRPLALGMTMRLGSYWLTLKSAGASGEARTPADSAATIEVDAHPVESPVVLDGDQPDQGSDEAREKDRLSRWESRLSQRERWLKARQGEARWEARWKAAGETLRDRSQAATTTPPAAPRPTPSNLGSASVTRRAPQPQVRPLPDPPSVSRIIAPSAATRTRGIPDPLAARRETRTPSYSPTPTLRPAAPPLKPAAARSRIEPLPVVEPVPDPIEVRAPIPQPVEAEVPAFEPAAPTRLIDELPALPNPFMDALSVALQSGERSMVIIPNPAADPSFMKQLEKPTLSLPAPAPTAEHEPVSGRPIEIETFAETMSAIEFSSVVETFDAEPIVEFVPEEIESSVVELDAAEERPRGGWISSLLGFRRRASAVEAEVDEVEEEVADAADVADAVEDEAPIVQAEVAEAFEVSDPFEVSEVEEPAIEANAEVEVEVPPAESPIRLARSGAERAPDPRPLEPLKRRSAEEEWPSVRQIMQNYAANAARSRETEPSDASSKPPRLQGSAQSVRFPDPTERRSPDSWSISAWVATPAAAAAVLALGLGGLSLSWQWARDDQAAGAVADLLLAERGPRVVDLETATGPSTTWWRTTPRHMYHWAVALHRGGADTAQVSEALNAAHGASPLASATRFALSRDAGDDSQPWGAMGLGRDSATLASAGHTLARAGKLEQALHAYRHALEIAITTDLDDLPAPEYLDEPAHRYSLPFEGAIASTLKDMAEQPAWSNDPRWIEAVPDFAVAQLAASRVLRERGRSAEADAALKRVIDRADAVKGDGPEAVIERAARAEALALLGRFAESEEHYRVAIAMMPLDVVKRSWWMNVADLASRQADSGKRRMALEAAKSTDPNDAITGRAVSTQMQEDGGRGDTRITAQ